MSAALYETVDWHCAAEWFVPHCGKKHASLLYTLVSHVSPSPLCVKEITHLSLGGTLYRGSTGQSFGSSLTHACMDTKAVTVTGVGVVGDRCGCAVKGIAVVLEKGEGWGCNNPGKKF